MTLQRSIVVIDDDPNILRLVHAVLSADGYSVWTASNGTEGTGKALDSSVDLVILDLGLPDADGLDIARTLRSQSDTPILMLTGRSDVTSRVEGLDAGADDYLTKPFNFDELRARVRSMLRRADLSAAPSKSRQVQVSQNGWRLEPAENSLIATDGRAATLTEREYSILSALMRRAGAAVSRDDLQRQITGRPWCSSDRSLDVHICHLRKKLREFDTVPCPIKTVRNRGFMFECPSTQELRAQ